MTQLREKLWVPRLAAGTPLIHQASLSTGTLGKNDFDARGGGFLADARARLPVFGDRGAVQWKMFELVMADAAA